LVGENGPSDKIVRPELQGRTKVVGVEIKTKIDQGTEGEEKKRVRPIGARYQNEKQSNKKNDQLGKGGKGKR